MTEFSRRGCRPSLRTLVVAPALLAAVWLGGCAVELENRQAAQEVARLNQPSGSLYIGWRVFQERCAACHGPAATGTGNAPDLLPRVRAMGPRRFVEVVLQRYEWNLSLPPAAGASPAEQVELVMQRRETPLNMPAWQGEPRVTAHITDLYAYLSARAQGTLGPQRPTP